MEVRANDTIWKVISSIPEGFYEMMTYMIPSGYMLVGIALLMNDLYEKGITKLCPINSLKALLRLVDGYWYGQLLLIVIVIGILYATGQMLNTLSGHYIICKWPRSYRIGEQETKKRIEKLEYDFATIKHNDPSYSLLLTKTRAKWVLSTAIAGSSVLLILADCPFGCSQRSLYYLVIAGISGLDSWKRYHDEKRQVQNWKRFSRHRASVPDKPKDGDGLPGRVGCSYNCCPSASDL